MQKKMIICKCNTDFAPSTLPTHAMYQQKEAMLLNLAVKIVPRSFCLWKPGGVSAQGILICRTTFLTLTVTEWLTSSRCNSASSDPPHEECR